MTPAMRRLGGLTLAGTAAAALLLTLLVPALFLAVPGDDPGLGGGGTTRMTSCTVIAADNSGRSARMSSEQLTNARTIIDVGEQHQVPPYGWTVALATAMQESNLRNLNYGDRDSLGLFQQRPSTGWGAPEQVMDPVYSARKFYEGLMRVPGWEQMPVTVAAQTVQRSAFPLAYARHEGVAASLVRTLTGADPAACRELAPGPWSLPIQLGFYELTSRFGPRINPIRRTADYHTGLDFAAPLAAPVHAASSGEVIFAGYGGGYGNLLKIRHAGGVETWYAHLAEIDVTPGTPVEPGQLVARVGSTGNSTGSHLHFEVRVNDIPTDPQPWLYAKGIAP